MTRAELALLRLRFAMWIAGTLLLVSTMACNGYTGDGRSIRPEALRREPGWLALDDMALIAQHAERDCGAAALAMVVARYRPDAVASAMALGDDGRRVSAVEIRDRARVLGFRAYVVEGEPKDLWFELEHGRPVIVGMAKPTVGGHVAHYEVVIGIHPESRRIATLDPSLGWRQTSYEGFLQEWQGSGRVLIVIVDPRAPPAS